MNLINAMRNILAGIAVCCVVSPVVCEEPAQIPRYAEQNGFLAPNLTGVVQPRVFFADMREKFPELEKDQYETSAEFRERTSMQEQRVHVEYPHEYVFQSAVQLKYDADRQVYYSDSAVTSGCVGGGVLRSTQIIGTDQIIFCTVGKLSSSYTKYSGMTRFGVEKEVSKSEAEYIALLFTNLSLGRSGFWFGRPDADGGRYLEMRSTFFVPIQLAKTLRTEHLSVLFVGRVEKSSRIRNYHGRSPTLDSPYESHTTYHGIQFHLTQILLCVDRTGEIIARKQIQ